MSQQVVTSSSPSFHLNVQVALLIWLQGRVLMGKHASHLPPNLWHFPTVPLAADETIEACAQRTAESLPGLRIQSMKNMAFVEASSASSHQPQLVCYVSISVQPQMDATEQLKQGCWHWWEPELLPHPLSHEAKHLLAEHSLARFDVS